MKKILIGIVLACVLVAVFAAVGTVAAQGRGPQGDGSFGVGGRGMMANSQGFTGTDAGLLHDYMTAAFADQLNVSVDEINERLASGEHMVDIALEQGLTVEEFRALMVDVRAQAIDQALADGVITQEQADWMKSRGAGMYGARGGMRGGFGGYNTGCPMLNQTSQ